MVKSVTLITFDVDGTLVSGSGSVQSKRIGASTHAKAFLHATGQYYNRPDFANLYESPIDFVSVERYHGSTDGLIALNLVNSAFNVPPNIAVHDLPNIFSHMHEYFSLFSDEEIMKDMEPLPGVMDTLEKIVCSSHHVERRVICGLVTGNVEGMARKKMRAVGIFQTGVLHKTAADQKVWVGEEETSFLGGFGSDFCSGDIADPTRMYKDRGEQIAIAYRRACSLLDPDQRIDRVIHVGDAPADVLAAKYCYEEGKFRNGPALNDHKESAKGEESAMVVVSCIGVATGSYTAEQLAACAGQAVPGAWEPVVLERGLADPRFCEFCGIV